MTHRIDVTCGRLLAARWHKLAEQRLEHLTELFESGRWRRYYSERAFLENIQEAKTAVRTWRNLAREPAETNRAIEIPRPSQMPATLETARAAGNRVRFVRRGAFRAAGGFASNGDGIERAGQARLGRPGPRAALSG